MFVVYLSQLHKKTVQIYNIFLNYTSARAFFCKKSMFFVFFLKKFNFQFLILNYFLYLCSANTIALCE